MQAGKLRHTALLQRPVRSTLATGEEVVSYADDLRCQAEIKGVSGRVQELAKQIAPTSTHVIRMRANQNHIVNESSRIIINGRVYAVRYVDNVMERNIWLEIYVSEHRGGTGDRSGN